MHTIFLLCNSRSSSTRVQAYTQHIPWAAPILYEMPGMGKNASKLMDFVIAMSQKRVKRGVAFTGEDLSSHLVCLILRRRTQSEDRDSLMKSAHHRNRLHSATILLMPSSLLSRAQILRPLY